MQAELNSKFGGAPHPGANLLGPDEQMGFQTGSQVLASEKRFEAGARGQGLKPDTRTTYVPANARPAWVRPRVQY